MAHELDNEICARPDCIFHSSHDENGGCITNLEDNANEAAMSLKAVERSR